MSTANITLVKPQERYVRSYLKAFDGANKGMGYDVKNLSSLHQWGIKFGFSHFKNNFIKDYREFNEANKKVVFWMVEGNNCLGEVSLAPREVGFLKGHAEPQEACKNIFGLKGEYIIAPTIKMSPKAKNKENFEKTFLGMAQMLKTQKVEQFLVNAPLKNKALNRYFSTICKFCKGKALKTKNTIEYLLPPNVEKIKAAFNELAMVATIRAKNGMTAVLNELKEITSKGKEKVENSSFLKSVRNKMLKLREKKQEPSGVKVVSLGYDKGATYVLRERRNANLKLRQARFSGR